MNSKPAMLILIVALGFGSITFSSAFAHETVNFDDIEVEIGWKEEPPLVGLPNQIVFKVSEVEKEGVKRGIPGAFDDLEAVAKFGGVEKNLDVTAGEKQGHYYSTILPTRIGTILIKLDGKINDVQASAEVGIEGVESQAVLAFPDKEGVSGQEIAALKSSIAGLQKEIGLLKSRTSTLQSGQENSVLQNVLFFGAAAMSLGSATVVLSVYSMTKAKKL